MTKERASLGFGDELEDFNPAEWAPKKPTNSNPKPDAAESRKVAEAAGFKSREPKVAPAIETPPAGQGTQRRRRTGRNAQFNLKAKPETIEAFCAIADQQGWGLGETLEQAVDLLGEKYPLKAQKSAKK